ncbi:hypothetical protein GPLA_1281 [Paraglaciecola polaris LMG 21857]|uniref:Uncharacterized protein n=2 Tax=Paraglaciecola polaris TaxID=222814 RepID=K7A9X0_9ALTE|nr:hypothetical protein GPLA_1281 [Paraglaciecola polaris LMG 21857]|tara:strand:- start:25112 stop:25297 length:186 start_codon:yes stop_codon:yes gene_type:complete
MVIAQFLSYYKITHCHQQRVRILQKLAEDASPKLHLYVFVAVKCLDSQHRGEEKHNKSILN